MIGAEVIVLTLVSLIPCANVSFDESPNVRIDKNKTDIVFIIFQYLNYCIRYRVIANLPPVPFRVGKETAVPAPKSFLRHPDDIDTKRSQFLQRLVNALGRIEVDGKIKMLFGRID